MAKGKFVYVYGDGSIMTDRNGYKSLSGAKGYAKAWNKRTKERKNKITHVLRK